MAASVLFHVPTGAISIDRDTSNNAFSTLYIEQEFREKIKIMEKVKYT